MQPMAGRCMKNKLNLHIKENELGIDTLPQAMTST